MSRKVPARARQQPTHGDRLAWWVNVDRADWPAKVQHEQLRMNPSHTALDYRHAHKRAQVLTTNPLTEGSESHG